MRLHLASPAEFDGLRKFREKIFAAELGIQESTYQDVFNDYFSKNVVLEEGSELVGTVRLAFSREAQEFFLSYLALAPEWRGHSAAGLLLGALFTLMKANGISVVRADSADENLPMYLSVGCRIAGLRFKKYGFRYEWTPLTYILGTNPESEARLMARAQAHLPRGSALQWEFEMHLVPCVTREDYRIAFDCLAASGKIMGVAPHFILSGAAEPTLISERLRSARTVSMKTLRKARKEFDFAAVNRCFNFDNRIVVSRDSPFKEIAQTYACLTRKSVEFTESHALYTGALPQAKSYLFVLTREELPGLLRSSFFRSQSFQLGLVTGEDEEEVSRFLLRNYFEFLWPVDGVQPARITVLRGLPADPPKWAGSHTVICHPETPDDAVILLRCLLHTGYTVGEAVRFSNLSFADKFPAPMLLAGDPCLRYASFRPSDVLGTDAPSAHTQFLQSPDSSVSVYHRQASDARARFSKRGVPYKHASFADSGLVHSFLFHWAKEEHPIYSLSPRATHRLRFSNP